jgi:hypothetical protein
MIIRMLKVYPRLARTAAMLLLFSPVVLAQRGYNWEYGIGTGVSNYLGDIGGREGAAKGFISDMQMPKTRWNAMAYAKYRFDPLFAVRVAYNYLRIEGDDKLTINEGRKYRNLSFSNDIHDLEATLHWLFFSSNKPMGVYSRSNVFFTGYLFAGIGGFMHNPKTEYNGSKVALQPLQTEGVSYSKFGYCLPFGAGFYVTINKRRRSHRIGLEVNWRYTNTDYLDDVSATWKNPSELSSNMSADLANRNDEVTDQPAGFDKNYGWQGTDKNGDPVNMAPRGDPDDKDSYISVNVTYGIAIKKGRGRYSKSKGRRIRSVTF